MQRRPPDTSASDSVTVSGSIIPPQIGNKDYAPFITCHKPELRRNLGTNSLDGHPRPPSVPSHQILSVTYSIQNGNKGYSLYAHPSQDEREITDNLYAEWLRMNFKMSSNHQGPAALIRSTSLPCTTNCVFLATDRWYVFFISRLANVTVSWLS